MSSYAAETIGVVMSYGVTGQEAIDFVVKDLDLCECSYELQCAVFDLYPGWYDDEIKKHFEREWMPRWEV